MHEFTITLNDAGLAEIQKLIAAYTLNTGKVLTVEEYLNMQAKNLCINQEFSAWIQKEDEQTKKDAEAERVAAFNERAMAKEEELRAKY